MRVSYYTIACINYMNLPVLHGNWIDLLLLILVVFYLMEGVGRGFILSLLDLGGFVVSFVASLKFYSFFGDLLVTNFSISRGISNALGFLLAGVLSELVLSLLIRVILQKYYMRIMEKLNQNGQKIKLIYIEKLLGIIPAIGEALIFTAFILTLFISLPLSGKIKKDIITSKIGGPLVSKTQGIERQLSNIFGQAVSETLTFITINSNPTSNEKIELGFTQKEQTVDDSAERTMLSLINQERVKDGLKPLLMAENIRKLARDYAGDMFTRGYFSHYNPENESPFDRMERYNIKFSAAGENLALAPNVSLAHQGLMNSPGHRANIMSEDFGKVGIGVVDGGIYGEMFVQEFTD